MAVHQVAPVVDGVVETDDEEATGTRLQSREASQRSLFDQAPQDGEPRKIIFDPRELYLHETAEETSFNFGVFFVQFAVHLLGGPVGFLLYFLTRRSDAIACGMTQGIVPTRAVLQLPIRERLRYLTYVFAFWIVPPVCQLAPWIAARFTLYEDSQSEAVATALFFAQACFFIAVKYAFLSKRERYKLFDEDRSLADRLRWLKDIQVWTGFNRPPTEEVMLSELELCAVSNGVDLADTWLMLREKDDDAADDGAHNPEYGVVSEDPLKVLNRFLEPLESCQWSKAIYPPPASFIVDDAAAAAMTALGSAATREDGSAAPASALLGSAPGATHPLESLVGMKLFSASTKWRQNKSFGRMSRGEDDFDEFRETDGDAEGIVTSPVGLLRPKQRGLQSTTEDDDPVPVNGHAGQLPSPQQRPPELPAAAAAEAATPGAPPSSEEPPAPQEPSPSPPPAAPPAHNGPPAKDASDSAHHHVMFNEVDMSDDAAGAGAAANERSAPAGILRTRSQHFSSAHRVAPSAVASRGEMPAVRPLAEAAAAAAAAIAAAELAAEELQDAMAMQVEASVIEARASRRHLVSAPSQRLRSGARRVTLAAPSRGESFHASAPRERESGRHPFQVPVAEAAEGAARLRTAGAPEGSVSVILPGAVSSASDDDGGCSGADDDSGAEAGGEPAGWRARRAAHRAAGSLAGRGGPPPGARAAMAGGRRGRHPFKKRSGALLAQAVSEGVEGADPIVLRVIPGSRASFVVGKGRLSVGAAPAGASPSAHGGPSSPPPPQPAASHEGNTLGHYASGGDSAPEESASAFAPHGRMPPSKHTTPSDMAKSQRPSHDPFHTDGHLSHVDNSQIASSHATIDVGGRRVIKMIRSFGQRSRTGRHRVNLWADQAAEATKRGRAVASGGQLAVALLLRAYRTAERVRRPVENVLRVVVVAQAFLPAFARLKKGQLPFGEDGDDYIFFCALCALRILGGTALLKVVVGAATDYIRRARVLYELGCLIRVTPSIERTTFDGAGGPSSRKRPGANGQSRSRRGKASGAGGRGSSTFGWALQGGLLTRSRDDEPSAVAHSRVWPTPQARNEGLWRRPLLDCFDYCTVQSWLSVRLVLLQYGSRVSNRMQASLTTAVLLSALLMGWQVVVALSYKSLQWELYAAMMAFGIALVGLLACQGAGAAANDAHLSHFRYLLQHRLLLRSRIALTTPGLLLSVTATKVDSQVDDLLAVGGEMVNNTEPLKALGFDATSELLKATVSFLLTALVVATSLLAPLSRADSASRASIAGSAGSAFTLGH